jgi:hypothetical protein
MPSRAQSVAPQGALPPMRSAAERNAAARQVEGGLRAIEAADRQIAYDTFDVQAAASQHGPDAARLFHWVRDETVWVPYRGTLRGAVGVLMDRMGNSLDRAILLAELLKAAGHEARLARAELPPQQAADLLPRLRTLPQLRERKAVAKAARTAPPAAKASPAGVPADFEATARRFGVDSRTSRDHFEKAMLQRHRTGEQILERVAAQTPALEKLLGKQPAAEGRAAEDARVGAALRDHWWVQWRDGDAWIDLDPLLPDAAPGKAVAAATQTVDRPDGVPADLRHRVEFRVVAERWEAGKVHQSTLLNHTLHPLEAMTVPVSLYHVPLDWDSGFDPITEPDVARRLRTLAAAQREWVPVLTIGDRQVIQTGVRETGEVVAQPTLDPAKRAGKRTGAAGERAADLLDASPPPTAPTVPSHFTAEWLEYVIHVPGDAPRVVRREVFDLIGPAARAAGKAAQPPRLDDDARLDRGLAMTSQVEVLVLPCRPSAAFVFHTFARNLLANGPLLTTLVRDEPSDPRSLNPILQKFRPLLSELWNVAADRHEFSPVRDLTFYDRPTVLTRHQFIRRAAGSSVTPCKAFDIVANETGVHRWSETAPASVRLVQGIVDTCAEAALTPECHRGANAGEALALAEERGEQWVTLQGPDDARLARLNLPPDVHQRITEDLAAGFHVLCPAGAAGAAGNDPNAGVRPWEVSWWRVHPVTGETLGIGGNGWGASLVEYTFTFVTTFFLSFAACITGAKVAMGGDFAPGRQGTVVLVCVGISLFIAFMAASCVLVGQLNALEAGVAEGGPLGATIAGGAVFGGVGGYVFGGAP